MFKSKEILLKKKYTTTFETSENKIEIDEWAVKELSLLKVADTLNKNLLSSLGIPDSIIFASTYGAGLSNNEMVLGSSELDSLMLVFNITPIKGKNIKYARLSGKETLEAYEEKREFRRLINNKIDLKEYNIKSIFVDPPREGIDQDTISKISHFDEIIYISCGFESLKRDIDILNKTHEIKKVAMFDQFPYTDHIESGVILEKMTPTD